MQTPEKPFQGDGKHTFYHRLESFVGKTRKQIADELGIKTNSLGNYLAEINQLASPEQPCVQFVDQKLCLDKNIWEQIREGLLTPKLRTYKAANRRKGPTSYIATTQPDEQYHPTSEPLYITLYDFLCFTSTMTQLEKTDTRATLQQIDQDGSISGEMI